MPLKYFQMELRFEHRLYTSCCSCKVPGMTLLQAYIITYNLLRGVAYKVLPFNSYALSPLMETFCNSCCRIAFSILKCSSLNFGNSKKSFGTESGEYGEYSISVIYFWARNCLTESALWSGALSWWRIQSLDQISGLFLSTPSANRFSIHI
jgi:hypothetical protein